MTDDSLPYPDPRVDAIISDPASYFAAARARAHTQAKHLLDEQLQQLQSNGEARRGRA